MTWIKTVSPEDDDQVRRAMEAQRELYPEEYATPIHPTPDQQSSEIVASHSLIPDALHHAFHLLLSAKLNTTQAVDRIKEEITDSPEVSDLLRFIEASQRGVTK